MTPSSNGHDGHDVTGEEVLEIDGTSMNDSESQLDYEDDCVSENSLDYLDDYDTLIEPGSPPPGYPEEEYPQSTSIPEKMDQESLHAVLQHITARSTEPALNTKSSDPSMCIVCKLLPAYSKGQVSYPTCGLTCASQLPNAPIPRPNRFLPEAIAPSSASQSEMCKVCHVRPRARKAGKIYPTCGFTCDAALTKTSSSKKGHSSVPPLDPRLVALCQKMSVSDHSAGTYNSPQQPSGAQKRDLHSQYSSHDVSQSPRKVSQRKSQTVVTDRRRRQPICVICQEQLCYDDRYVTCGIKCAEKLCKRGNSNPKICDYCHRRPKVPGHNQCGKTCGDNAGTACLLCRCRPKFGRYPLCGRTCKKIATKWTPLILEARLGHTIQNEVEQRFKRAWKASSVCPSIKKIYKIIENESFLLPYDRYKKRYGNEVFRYHGTTRRCTLGSHGNTRLCSSTACALCSILRTSFKVSLADPRGAFGAGVYTSSAANKAYSYINQGSGAMLLTKVVLGKVYKVTGWNEVMSCPLGYNSVVYHRQNGTLNETIVYTDDAIRPVFLIIF